MFPFRQARCCRCIIPLGNGKARSRHFRFYRSAIEWRRYEIKTNRIEQSRVPLQVRTSSSRSISSYDWNPILLLLTPFPSSLSLLIILSICSRFRYITSTHRKNWTAAYGMPFAQSRQWQTTRLPAGPKRRICRAGGKWGGGARRRVLFKQTGPKRESEWERGEMENSCGALET